MNRTVVFSFALVLASPLLAAAQDGVRYSLFNGQDLNGWHVSGCQAGVEDGLLVLQADNGFLRSEHRYRDFVLELKWHPRKEQGWDSGIYFRCELPAEGKPWPTRYQANLKQGQEGNVGGLRQAVSSGLAKPGAWNQLKLTVIGDSAKMEINGQPAWEAQGVEPRDGFIGIQSEVPLGGQFEFKDIWITELGYQSLFNGNDLAGWEGAGQDAAKCWQVADGLLTCTGEKGPWLRSLKEYGDFNLRLEYKLRPSGNSGVYVRVPADGNHHGDGAGIEIQVLDDHAERYKDLKPYQYTGSLYAIVAADPRVSKKPEEWNSLEIDCSGTRYRVLHNGVIVVNADEQSAAELSGRRTNGFLGLQNHSEEVWFRNIRLGESAQTP
jgi:hypothetical protein